MATLEGISLGEQLRRFWRWWTGELVLCIPAALRNWTRKLRVAPAVLPEDGGFSIYRFNGKTWLRVGQAQGATPEARSKALAVQLRASRIDRFTVALPPGQFLAKTIVLPQAAEENLRNALQYELDRHTPFKPDEVGFDCCVVGRNDALREIVARLVIAQKSTIGNAVSAVAGTGLTVVAVQPALPDRDSLTLNLLPHDDAGNRVVQRIMLWAPWLLLLALGAVAILLPIFQKRAQVIDLQPQVNVAAQQASAADALHQTLDRAQSEYNFVLQKRYAMPTSLQLLNEVTRILPDDTWLQNFDLRTTTKGRELQLQGETGVAGKMIELFEQSPLLAGASFKSPVTQAPGSAASRFHIGMDVKEVPPPAGRVIRADPTAPAAPPPAPGSVPGTPPPAAAGAPPGPPPAGAGTPPPASARPGPPPPPGGPSAPSGAPASPAGPQTAPPAPPKSGGVSSK